jgi:hypothetical protein
MKTISDISVHSLNIQYIDCYNWLSKIIKMPENNRFFQIKNKLQYSSDNYGKNGFVKEIDRNDVLLSLCIWGRTDATN